jgi:transcriptional regulator with XRE-family HTH domain
VAFTVDDHSEIGRTLRQIRHARGKSLAVVAGLAGISKQYLSMIELGERAVERRSLIVALANALEVAPNEITGSALPVPREREDDHALTEVRLALLGVSLDEPCGEVQPVEQLTARVTGILVAQNDCRTGIVGAALPSLIRDLHATVNAHRDERDVLRLLTLAHMQGTQAWLTVVGAPPDLAWQAAMLTRHSAEHLDEPVSLAVSAYGMALGLISVGAFELASRPLAAVDMPLVTPEDMQVAGSLALASSLLAAARKEPAQQTSALEHAAELADRTGEGNALGFGFGPSNVGVWRLQCALEAGDPAEAARIAETVDAQALTVRAREAVYWRDYGRALARLPKQRDTAVMMLRKAERISPEHVHRHPFTRSTIAELLVRAKRDAVGRELRGLAYRAALPM